MAHSCPVCQSYCTCRGDMDDCDFGVDLACICCLNDDGDDFEEDEDDIDERNDPNDSRNL